MGVDRIRMSASRIAERMPGHASPPPMSVPTPGFTAWSAIRMTVPVTPWSVSAASVCSASSSELEGVGEGESVQTSATARSGVMSMGFMVFGYPPIRVESPESPASARDARADRSCPDSPG